MRRSSSRDLFEGSYQGRPVRGSAIWLWLVLAGIAVSLLTLFFGGEYLQRWFAYRHARVVVNGVPSVDWVEPARNIVLNTLPEIPFLGSTGELEKGDLLIHDLRIGSDELHALQQTAEAVTAQGIATGIERPYLPAEYLLDGQWIPVQVKPRGLYSMHYLARRPSLRIKFPRDRYFERKRQINISAPYDKGLTADVTVNWELERHGILTWDSRFVVLRVNGETVGVFQEIEQFGRSMSDRNRRSEGVMFSGSGQVFGQEGSGPAWEKARAAIGLVQECTQKEPADHCTWEFFREYFDVDRWAWAGAMKVLNQSTHGWHHDNLRLFWDPALGSFEPIPWDYNILAVKPEQNPEAELLAPGLATNLNRIPEYRRLRDPRLWILLNERVEPMIEYADALFDRIREPLSHDLRHPDPKLDEERQATYRQRLRTNAAYLKERFQRNDLGMSIWQDADDAAVVLEFENRAKAFVEVTAIRVERAGESQRVDMVPPVIVDGSWRGLPGIARARVQVPKRARIVGVEAENRVTGATLAQADVRIQKGSGLPGEVVSESGDLDPELAIEGVHVADGRVVFGPGIVRLEKSLTLPPHIDVVFSPGLDLRMGAGVSLGIYGDLLSRGTAAAPVRISGGAEEAAWGTVFVQGSRLRPRRVVLSHTVFDGGVGGENHRTLFTAPFAVHGGIVSLQDSKFLNSRAIDGINLKYADVDVRNVLIRGSVDDAFDCDFCEGEISMSRVEQVGGDGFDFSGSELLVEDNVVVRCGDKGFSIGEETRAELRGNRVEDCYTGIAVKDLSQAQILGGELSRVDIGVSLYVKKPTFGPSRVRVEGLKLNEVATDFMKDDASSLEWKGRSGA